MEKNKAENRNMMLALVIRGCPGKSSWRRWHLNKNMKEIVGTPGEDGSSGSRAGQSTESERKADAQSAQHGRGAVGEYESGVASLCPPAPAQVPRIIGVGYLINSTLLLLSALSVLSIFWLLPA